MGIEVHHEDRGQAVEDMEALWRCNPHVIESSDSTPPKWPKKPLLPVITWLVCIEISQEIGQRGIRQARVSRYLNVRENFSSHGALSQLDFAARIILTLYNSTSSSDEQICFEIRDRTAVLLIWPQMSIGANLASYGLSPFSTNK